MSGDWIKMRCDLADDPAVIEIAGTLSVDEYAVTGRLHKLWSWADKHCSDGHAKSVTFVWINRYVGQERFAETMQQVGWLAATESGISFPRFDRHNGESAKKRAEAAERKRIERQLAAAAAAVALSMGQMSQQSRDKSATREEKRREDSKPIKTKTKAPAAPTFDPKPELSARGVSEQTAADWIALRVKKRAPVTKTVLGRFIAEADKAAMPLERVLVLCCERGWAGFEASWAAKDGRGAPSGPAKFNPTAHVNRNRNPS